MNRKYTFAALSVAALMATGCWSHRFVTADRDLERLYVGRSYYDIVAEFGQPDHTSIDGMEGTSAVYYSASLNGTSASSLYSEHLVRNSRTKEEGMPSAAIVFSFRPDMRCYAVDSDFERERTREQRVEQGPQYLPGDYRPKFPRSLDFPFVEGCSPFAKPVSIEQVELLPDCTVVHFQYRARTPKHRPINDIGIYVHADTYLADRTTGRRYPLQKAEGISYYPERTQFAHNDGGYDVLVYSLVFGPLPAEAETIDIVEPGHSGFDFYGVDIKTPLIAK